MNFKFGVNSGEVLCQRIFIIAYTLFINIIFNADDMSTKIGQNQENNDLKTPIL